MKLARVLTIVAMTFCPINSAMAEWVTSGDNMYSDVPGNVGVGTSAPGRKLDVGGDIQLSGEIITNSGTKWFSISRGAYVDLWAQGYDVISFEPNRDLLAKPPWDNFKIMRQQDKVGLHMTGDEYVMGKVGIGTTSPSAKLTVRGNVLLQSESTGATVLQLGEGLDYAEGFNVTRTEEIGPGTVLVIDPTNPGKLAMSTVAYDTKVAGIVAGAKSLGSGVRLGTDQFDQDVALAGRVYCNVDATEAAVQPGDLLTTSAVAGYAMKASDHVRAQGAILGKAMESLEQGKKDQILVLVTLQ